MKKQKQHKTYEQLLSEIHFFEKNHQFWEYRKNLKTLNQIFNQITDLHTPIEAEILKNRLLILKHAIERSQAIRL